MLWHINGVAQIVDMSWRLKPLRIPAHLATSSAPLWTRRVTRLIVAVLSQEMWTRGWSVVGMTG